MESSKSLLGDNQANTNDVMGYVQNSKSFTDSLTKFFSSLLIKLIRFQVWISEVKLRLNLQKSNKHILGQSKNILLDDPDINRIIRKYSDHEFPSGAVLLKTTSQFDKILKQNHQMQKEIDDIFNQISNLTKHFFDDTCIPSKIPNPFLDPKIFKYIMDHFDELSDTYNPLITDHLN